MSGRYTELRPKFYIPDFSRAIINDGTKMKPSFMFDWDIDANKQDTQRHKWTRGSLRSVSRSACLLY
ncbi:hypothetical protein, partial [Salmonella enterica]|uniref:hypothetical protein n=1 Tax=Salmonella enterica TaxID=28901 RepID=UPI003F4B01FB